MRKYLLLSIIFIATIFIITGCTNNKTIEDTKINDNNHSVKESESENMETITNIKISINDINYNAILEDNDTAQTFVKLLPKEFTMNELNGNEKYVYLDNPLPSNSMNPKYITTGDIMLYGDNCLVIFYKSFDTNYSYTKIGHIENLPNLGNDNITVKFKT